MSTDLDILKDDSSSSFVLVFHELLCVFTFFVRVFLEILAETRQGDIITVKVERLENKNNILNTLMDYPVVGPTFYRWIDYNEELRALELLISNIIIYIYMY